MTALRLSLAALAGSAACIVPGYDHLPEWTGATGTTGASATTQSTASASTTTTPGTTATGASTAGTDPTAGTDQTGSCPGDCTTGTTTAGSETSTATTAATTGDATTVECMGDCTPRRAFVTLSVFTGDFASGGDPFVLADEKCNNDAMDAMLPQTFKAWISDGTMGPKQRFDAGFEGHYVLTDVSTTKVASGFSDLLDGSLAHAIDADVNGVTVDVGIEVWTGVKSNGDPATICGTAWNSTNGMGTFGNLDATNGSWTDASLDACSKGRRLYCFEDP